MAKFISNIKPKETDKKEDQKGKKSNGTKSKAQA